MKGFLWSQKGLNLRPPDYESGALTSWAMRPAELAVAKLMIFWRGAIFFKEILIGANTPKNH